MRASCCAIPQACWTQPTKSACPAPAGCTTCSSRMKRCRPANGNPAAKASTIRYGFHPSPFGMALVIGDRRGLAGLAFADTGEERAALADMQSRWPKAKYVEDRAATAPIAHRIFDPEVVAAGPAAAGGADRHRFRSAGVGDAAEDPDGPRHRPIRISPARSASRKPRAPSAPRSARIRSRSWCRAIA